MSQEFSSPVGRLVQGSFGLQQETDQTTNQKKVNADGTPKMSVFFALAYPKVINGVLNAEWAAFRQLMNNVGAAAWPQFFPQGAAGACTNPKFSWKYQDGDGFDTNGKPVNDKPGFAGHHILKFSTDFVPKCFIEGKFDPAQQLQEPDAVIKRGFWVRIIGQIKSNNADLSKQQVPGIAIYPNLVSFVGQGEEIFGGINAAEAFAAAPLGVVPTGVTGAPLGVPSVAAGVPPVAIPAVVVPPAVVIPVPPPVVVPAPPAGPVVSPALAAQGITWGALEAQGWTEAAARAAGHIL